MLLDTQLHRPTLNDTNPERDQLSQHLAEALEQNPRDMQTGVLRIPSYEDVQSSYKKFLVEYRFAGTKEHLLNHSGGITLPDGIVL